jgi:hypothetical protein
MRASLILFADPVNKIRRPYYIDLLIMGSDYYGFRIRAGENQFREVLVATGKSPLFRSEDPKSAGML